jgi:acetoin utilization deacetylase AcuC-like enzyme
MAVAVYSHPDCALHDPGPGHPEAPRRIEAVLAALAAVPAAELRTALPADPAIIRTAHTQAHLAALTAAHEAGGQALDPDTVMSAHSWDAMLGALGAVLAAVDHGHAGASHAFAAVRPPGHHASADRVMGFCLVNNAVIAARRFQALGRRRVLIVDWDVHHGNGTADVFRAEPRVRYVSIHQAPYYPGTGGCDDIGAGNLFHVPCPPSLPPSAYTKALLGAVDRALTGFAPSLVVFSAGFDALRGDPLAGFTWEPEDYAQLTRAVLQRAGWPAALSVLEGGYDPTRVAEAAVQHAAALAG